ncbi:MAG: hypothetical protein WBD28_04040 [Candidatus Zixiibacteriota bacterium]
MDKRKKIGSQSRIALNVRFEIDITKIVKRKVKNNNSFSRLKV